MLKSCHYSIHGGEIAALEVGNMETAETSVVFLHGWLDNAASFITTIEALHHHNPSLHLCAIDLPGHGLSTHKSGSNFYPFHDYIDDVYQVLSNFSANKRVLVGHSLGALIASCYSAAFPEQISGLVQIEGFGPLAEPASNSVARLRDGVLSRQRIRRKPQRSPASIEEAVARRAKVNQLEAMQIEPIVRRGLIQENSTWRWRHDQKLQSDSLYRMHFEHAAGILQAVQCPQYIILGEDGFSYLNTQIEKWPNFDVHVIKGGHHCHLQYPSRVSDLIFGLVNKI
ncbi:alpha/beta fold hydrolase [Vibrio sp. NTOU-M3]|uniref:alpha/beta fold hydrolase n=1 Tax=Vibrio sp. NTOU-M3 TaxID=3234954 RepID=UPI00349F8659